MVSIRIEIAIVLLLKVAGPPATSGQILPRYFCEQRRFEQCRDTHLRGGADLPLMGSGAADATETHILEQLNDGYEAFKLLCKHLFAFADCMRSRVHFSMCFSVENLMNWENRPWYEAVHLTRIMRELRHRCYQPAFAHYFDCHVELFRNSSKTRDSLKSEFAEALLNENATETDLLFCKPSANYLDSHSEMYESCSRRSKLFGCQLGKIWSEIVEPNCPMLCTPTGAIKRTVLNDAFGVFQMAISGINGLNRGFANKSRSSNLSETEQFLFGSGPT